MLDLVVRHFQRTWEPVLQLSGSSLPMLQRNGVYGKNRPLRRQPLVGRLAPDRPPACRPPRAVAEIIPSGRDRVAVFPKNDGRAGLSGRLGS